MLCEKCGKNNSDSVTVCKHCGSLLPQRASCGGFSDILNYEAQAKAMSAQPTAPSHGTAGGVDAARLQYLERQMSSLQLFRKKAEKAFLFAIISLVVALTACIFAITSSCSSTEEKIETVVEQTEKRDDSGETFAPDMLWDYINRQTNEFGNID